VAREEWDAERAHDGPSLAPKSAAEPPEDARMLAPAVNQQDRAALGDGEPSRARPRQQEGEGERRAADRQRLEEPAAGEREHGRPGGRGAGAGGRNAPSSKPATPATATAGTSQRLDMERRGDCLPCAKSRRRFCLAFRGGRAYTSRSGTWSPNDIRVTCSPPCDRPRRWLG